MARNEDEEDTGETTTIGRAGLLDPHSLRRDRASVVVIAGAGVGEMFAVGGGLVIGRGGDADVRIVDDQISRRHARIGVHGQDVFVEDLGSKNGTFLNGSPVRRELLRDGDKIQIGPNTVLRYALHDSLEESFQKQMYESALRDPLTRVYNRKYLLDRTQSELAYALRHGSPLSFLMIDVDHFKKVNDTHGHPAGDAVLVTLARHVLRVIRSEDVFARYGGEEFAILSRGIALDGATKFAERLRAAIETYPFVHEGARIPVTISIGIAALPAPDVARASELVGRADSALYRAKHEGRNRVRVSGTTSLP